MEKPRKYKDWLTQLECANVAGVSVNTINYYVRMERVEAVRIGRQWLISPESLREIYPDTVVTVG